MSSLPVVDETSGRLRNVICKSDILDLLSEMLKENHQTTPLANEGPESTNQRAPKDVDKPEMVMTSRSVGQVLSATVREAVKTVSEEKVKEARHLAVCQVGDTLVTVVEKLASRQIRCLFVLDASQRPLAAISVTDLMEALIS